MRTRQEGMIAFITLTRNIEICTTFRNILLFSLWKSKENEKSWVDYYAVTSPPPFFSFKLMNTYPCVIVSESFAFLRSFLELFFGSFYDVDIQ